MQVAEGTLTADLLKARAEVVRRIEERRAAADPAVRRLGDDDGGRGEEGGGGGRRCHEKKEEQGREARRLPARSHRESFGRSGDDDELARLWRCRFFFFERRARQQEKRRGPERDSRALLTRRGESVLSHPRERRRTEQKARAPGHSLEAGC